MADAELWLEIFNAIGCDEVTRDDIGEYCIDSLPISDRAAHDLIAMQSVRWLGDRCWRTLFIESDRIKVGYAPDGGICDLSITGPVAQTLCEAITRQLEMEEK